MHGTVLQIREIFHQPIRNPRIREYTENFANNKHKSNLRDIPLMTGLNVFCLHLLSGIYWVAFSRLSQIMPKCCRLASVVYHILPMMTPLAMLLRSDATADGICFTTGRYNVNLEKFQFNLFIYLLSVTVCVAVSPRWPHSANSIEKNWM